MAKTEKWLGDFEFEDEFGFIHKIDPTVRLNGLALLSRWTNAEGKRCSSIYIGNREIWWHYLEKESRMVEKWNGGEYLRYQQYTEEEFKRRQKQKPLPVKNSKFKK